MSTPAQRTRRPLIRWYNRASSKSFAQTFSPAKLLTDGLHADDVNIDFERQVPEVRGHIDALLGRTVLD
jgi:hypothetical protein